MNNETGKKQTLVYFIDKLESPFVVNDIKELAGRYEKLLLFLDSDSPKKNTLPDNVVYISNYIDWKTCNKTRILLFNFLRILGIIFFEVLKSRKWIPLKKNLIAIILNIHKADVIHENLLPHIRNNMPTSQVPLYSFWFYDVTFMCILRWKYGFSNIVSRAHSGDLYEDHPSNVKRPNLRHYQLSGLKNLLPVSRGGSEYMRTLYPGYKEKIRTVYLGTRDKGKNARDPEKLVIVSCARFRHHKRLDKIVESLLKMKNSAHWIHIGDERLGEDIAGMAHYMNLRSELKEHSNISMEPMGVMDNEKILNLYNSRPVSVFLSMSENEGIPVSMMEAISFGIPVIATDAGGCSEIVTNESGLLLPVDVSAGKLAEILDNFTYSTLNTDEFRARVRGFWEQNFSCRANYGMLMAFLNNE